MPERAMRNLQAAILRTIGTGLALAATVGGAET
jgi:hypothetical protein